ncbi:MAG TPA: TetR family transcriptional regulator [Burkholderiaceae bacterium]|nr:TetR family transcriptional regulator [Burkholderiaceae bacterium]
MKITRAQSQENRARVVEAASSLFRERGYAGVNVADLMAAAGLTHGGFYKHFGSKADLMAEAAEYGLAAKMREYEGVDMRGFVNRYVSREHRDGRGDGCTMAALCGDAARLTAEIRATFASGIANMLAAVERGAIAAGEEPSAARAKAIAIFSQMLGALVLSRACPDDSPLSDEILEACRAQILATLDPVVTASARKAPSRRRSSRHVA